MTDYSPPDYWTARGKLWEQEARDRGFWDSENPPLLDLLDTLDFASVLDVGCGFGRVGASIQRRWPKVAYTGIDVSPDLIDGARRRLGERVTLIVGDLATFDTDQQYDLVLAVSVLGHIRPEDVGGLLWRMRRWALKDIIHIDWNEVGGQTTFQYGHDYEALHGPAEVIPYGRQSIWHYKP